MWNFINFPPDSQEKIYEFKLQRLYLPCLKVIVQNPCQGCDTMSLSKKLASSISFVTPERLPPALPSTKFHSVKVYGHIKSMVWIGCKEDVDAKNWTLILQDNHLVQVMPDMAAVPANLLKIIHCNGSSSWRSARCSCRSYRLSCQHVCGLC